jgi:hypothetical protein
VILVMRSIVITFGHNSRSLHPPRFVVGFFCKLVSVVRVFKGAL